MFTGKSRCIISCPSGTFLNCTCITMTPRCLVCAQVTGESLISGIAELVTKRGRDAAAGRRYLW